MNNSASMINIELNKNEVNSSNDDYNKPPEPVKFF